MIFTGKKLKVKKMFKMTALMVIFLIVSCNNLNEPGSTDGLSDTEIKYRKTGGWIDTSLLNISENGSVTAHLISHSSLDTLKSGCASLDLEERDEILQLFNSFKKYDSYYEPHQWYTDGNYHIVILTNHGTSDTVTVYEPQNTILPDDLTKIITKLEYLWLATIEK